MACEIPENPVSSCQEQHEVVAVDFSVPAESEITEQPRNETVAYAPAIRVIYSGFSVEIQNTAASETIRNTITAPVMLGELSGVAKIFIITGRTDMLKSFDGLMAIIRDTYQLDPYANALYLFCGRDSRKLKALHYDKDGFVLYQKRLGENGRFQWSRNASEARLLTRQEFRWLMEGLAIDQPKAIRPSKEKKDF